jgi:hypothetical protein
VGYEIWSLPIRKVCNLQLCESNKLRNVFGPTKDEVRILGYYVTRVTDYGLDDARFNSQQDKTFFSLLEKVYTSSEAHPGSCSLGIWDGGKAAAV